MGQNKSAGEESSGITTSGPGFGREVFLRLQPLPGMPWNAQSQMKWNR
jgi:hypothetical protein